MRTRLASAGFLAILAFAAAGFCANAAGVPPTAHWLAERGDALEEKGEHKDAIAKYTEAIEDDPNFAYAYASRCQSEWALDQNQIAARDCRRAIDLDPKSAYAYRQLGMVLNDTGDPTAALASVNRSVELDSSLAFTFAVRCQILTDLKKYDDAYADCNRAIAMEPKSLWGHLQLGRAELENGDYTAADASLTWVIVNHAETESAWYNRALTRLHTPDLSGALSDINHYIGANPADGDGYYIEARIELARNHKRAAGDVANEAQRRYLAAHDAAGVTKAKAFIADNDLDSATGASSMLAGALGVFVIIIFVFFAFALSGLTIWGLWRILDRAGLQGPLALLCIVPFGLIACLAILAFTEWKVKKISSS
jgi:tetratricopeptide (TPR) repeat protein